MAEYYREMSEESDADSSDSEDMEIASRIHLQTFDMESKRNCENLEVEFASQSDSLSDSDTEHERSGNTDWCDCGKKCRPMETYTESLSCQDTNEIQEHLFTGKRYNYSTYSA